MSKVKTGDQVQRQYLADFYQHLDGVNWKYSNNWLTEAPIEQVVAELTA